MIAEAEQKVATLEPAESNWRQKRRREAARGVIEEMLADKPQRLPVPDHSALRIGT